MKRIVALLAAAVLAYPPVSIHAETASMTRTAFIRVRVHAPADQAFPLFDPVNESKWDPEWKPKLLGDRVEEGLVFLVDEGDDKSTWLIDRYELAAHSIGYVVARTSTLTRIRITVLPEGPQSVATVAYTRTALDDRGREAVEHFAEHFPSQASHWETAINGYLDTMRR